MNQKKSIGINFIMNTVVQGSAYILPFVVTPYVSRILLPEGMGRISYATSIITYFIMFALLGVPTYGVRECAKVSSNIERLSQTVKQILIINLIMGILVYFALGVFIKLPVELSVDKSLLLLMSPAIFLNIINIDWLYKGIERFSEIAVRNVIVRLLFIILIFVFVKKQEDYKIYGVFTMLASYGVGIWNFWGSRKYVDYKVKCNVRKIKEHLIPITVFFGMTVATTIYTNLDTVMLGIIRGNSETGIYDSAIKIKSILVSAVSALGIVLLPRVTQYINDNNIDKFKEICRHALNIVVVMSLSFVFFSELNAKNIILTFSGNKFEDSIPVLRYIVPTVFLIGVTNITGIQMLVPLGKERWVFFSEIMGAVVDFFFNMVFIPVLGAKGAALGTVIAELVVTIIQIYACRKYVMELVVKLQYSKIFITILVASVVNILINLLDLSCFCQLVISAVFFYTTMFIILLVLKEQETMYLLKKIMRRR